MLISNQLRNENIIGITIQIFSNVSMCYYEIHRKHKLHLHAWFIVSPLSVCQAVPVWPLLPVLLPAVRLEEPRGDALQRPALQMWILRPSVRRRHNAQQPHTHPHRGEAVQVSKSENPPQLPFTSPPSQSPAGIISTTDVTFSKNHVLMKREKW